MASVWEELKRRNVVKVAVAYAIVAWLLMQVVSTFFPALNLPAWTITFVAALLIIGFPIALLLTWAYELTPGGMKPTKSVPLSESITNITGRKLDFVIIGFMAVGIGFLLIREYLPEDSAPEEVVPEELTVQEPVPGSLDPMIERKERDVMPKSIAVLPFENLSPDPDDAYFAAGIHEQILNELAKIQDLSVIARTTMIRYADSPPPIPEIASELRVETVMEGSVRYAGNQVRVTAQLIDGGTGTHLWTEDYDGDLADIFGIQSDIAIRIADALDAELTRDEQEGMDRPLTSSPQALALYLSGLSTTDNLSAMSDLERATEIDPNFADAYALLAFWQASALIGFTASPDEAPELERLARSNADRALILDSSLGLAHAALGTIHLANWRGTEAETTLRRAYELSPSDVGVAQMYARFKRHRHEYDQAIELMERAVELDPNNPGRQQNMGVAYRYAGEYESAAEAFKKGLEMEPTSETLHYNLAIAEVELGNYSEALRLLSVAETLDGAEGPDTYRLIQMAYVYAIAGRPDGAMRVFNTLEQRAQEESIGEASWASIYAAIGDHEAALEHLETAIRERDPTDASTLAQFAANVFVDPVIETDSRYRELLGSLWDDE